MLPALLAILGVGSSLASGYMRNRAAVDQGEAEADAAQYDAGQALEESYAEGARRRRMALRELDQERADIGASGFALEGSPLDTLAANAATYERNAFNVEQAGRLTSQLDLKRANQARKMGRRGAVAALIGAAGGAAGQGGEYALIRGGG